MYIYMIYIYVYNVYRYGRLKMVVYLINVLRPSRPELFVCLGHRQRAPLKETHLPTIGLFVSETDYLVLEEWTLNLSEISFCNSNDTTTPGSPGDRKVTKAGKRWNIFQDCEVFTQEQQKDNAFLGSIWV